MRRQHAKAGQLNRGPLTPNTREPYSYASGSAASYCLLPHWVRSCQCRRCGHIHHLRSAIAFRPCARLARPPGKCLRGSQRTEQVTTRRRSALDGRSLSGPSMGEKSRSIGLTLPRVSAEVPGCHLLESRAWPLSFDAYLINDFFDCPDVIGHSSFHCRCNPERPVNPSKIVVHKVESNAIGVILNFLAESIR